MKRVVLCILALLLLTCGCAQTQEDPFRVETVVLIPVDPTDAPTEEPTEVPTQAPTEAPTQPQEPKETTAPKKITTYKSSGSGGKTSSSGKNQPSAAQKPKETQPRATEPAQALPPALTPNEPPYNPSTYTLGELEHALLQELNRYRLDAAVGELAINERLSGIAHLRAQEVSVSWSHTRLDGSGYVTALSDYDYEYKTAAELLIHGSVESNAAYFASKWMGTESIRAHICSADYTTAGIGIYGQEGMLYLVCLLTG